MYGLALLMVDKPWYDLKKGLEWLRKGAEEAAARTEHVAADSIYQYGIILLDGQFGVPRDPVEGKYWIDKVQMQDLSWQLKNRTNAGNENRRSHRLCPRQFRARNEKRADCPRD